MDYLSNDDPTNITGIGALINNEGAGSFDPQALEQDIIRGMGGGLSQAAEAPTPEKVSIAKKFESEIMEITGAAPAAALPDPFGSLDVLPTPPSLKRTTHEENMRQVVSQAYTPTPSFSIEHERNRDKKTENLEQISVLLEMMADDGEDISKIPTVNHHSSDDDIIAVLDHLRLKNDRKRCGTFAEEAILMAVHWLESCLDGTFKFGGYAPDLTGWHRTVQTKLRRQRYNTAELVANLIQESGIGPGTRILMELVPSAFLYSRMQKSSGGRRVTDDEFNAATNRLRDFDAR